MASDSSNGFMSATLKSSILAGAVCLLSILVTNDDSNIVAQDDVGPAFEAVPLPPVEADSVFDSDRNEKPVFASEPEFLPPVRADRARVDDDDLAINKSVPEFSDAAKKVIVSDPVLAELLLQEAILAFDDQDYAAALQILDTMPASPAGEYYRGLCLLRTGNAAAAAGVLEAVRNNGQASDELRLDASIALLKSGQPQEAAAELGEILSSDPEDGHARYFLGLALYEQGDTEAAREQIELAAQYDATLAPYRDAFRTYDQRLGAAALGSYQPLRYPESEPRRWNLSFLTGFEYDSNVPLSPVFSGFGGNIQREDSRMVVGLFGDYRFVQENDEVVGVTASAYSNFHFDLSQYDVQTYSTSAYWNRAFGDWIAGLTYNFGETLLNNNQFATNHRLTASTTKRWGEQGHTTGFYEYEFLDITGLSLIPAQNRTGHTNSVGITQAWYFGPQNLGRIYAGYRFDNRNAYGSDFDMNSQMINARVEYPIFQDLVFDAEARQFWDRYSNGNSLDFFERSRKDQRLELRTGLQKYITENTSLRLDYTYVDSNSNVANLFGVEFYSYQKHVLSALLIYDF
ncbi:MAG: tetratricopeptide repeat protein [Rhodopirellula sp.]|nr:tetratricopeptide repeat protein [Rhodopirellula sp.]